MSETTPDEDDSTGMTVADRVLTRYLRDLKEDPAMEEISDRMRAALLDGKVINEHSLRRALFEEPTK